MKELTIDCVQTTQEIIHFLTKTVSQAGFSQVVISLSGGLDSATTAFLAVRAFGPEKVFCGLFPYGKFDPEGLKGGKLVLEKLKIPSSQIFFLNLKPLADWMFEKTQSFKDKIRRGNILARLRMILLYDLAKKHRALVLGTENKTEYLLGYFTRFGDEACDLAPLRHLYKTQVRQLARFLGVPNFILQRSPTAGLWPGQTDEEELGFSYKEADQILYLYLEKKKSKKEIVKVGFKEEVIEKVVKRLEENKFKHELPYFL